MTRFNSKSKGNAKSIKTVYQERIDKAMSAKSVLDVLPENATEFTASDVVYQVVFFKSCDLADDLLNWIIGLTERNMKDFYNGCSWGWNQSQKLKEFKDKMALFLVAENKETKEKIGFTHFRFDWDYDRVKGVVYCYELQIEESYQGKGIGSYLMKLLELIAAHFKFPKVILTCLKHDKPAVKFYQEKHSFTVDPASPSKFQKNECYEILSKRINLSDS